MKIIRAEGETLAQAALLADELFPGHAPGELLAEWEELPRTECVVFHPDHLFYQTAMRTVQ